MIDPSTSNIIITVVTVSVSIGIGVGVLRSTINGHVKNGDVHMNAKEKKEIATVVADTKNNNNYIGNLREDLQKHEQNVREDLQVYRTEMQASLKDGLDRINETIKNGG